MSDNVAETRLVIGGPSKLRETSSVLPPMLGESESEERSLLSPFAQVLQILLWLFFSFFLFLFLKIWFVRMSCPVVTHTVMTVALNCESEFTRLTRLLDVVKCVEWFETNVLAEENVALDPPRQNLEQLVAHVSASRNGEDVVQLFEGALFCFGDPEEDHEKGYDVKAAE
jgi:hypothetical protein